MFGAYGIGFAVLPDDSCVVAVGGRRAVDENCAAYTSVSSVWVSFFGGRFFPPPPPIPLAFLSCAGGAGLHSFPPHLRCLYSCRV